MTEKGAITRAGPMIIQDEGCLDFRIVLREWKHNNAGDCIEWVVHKMFYPKNGDPPYFAYGHYDRSHEHAAEVFLERVTLELEYHDFIETSRAINRRIENARVLREQWTDMGQKIAAVIEEIEYNEETSVSQELYSMMQAINEYHELWSPTVDRYLSQ